jgi:hypothetical protein
MPEGRSHATRHHLVARRLRKLLQRTYLAKELAAPVFCYPCGEEILHNPPLTKANLQRFAALVRRRNIAALPDGEREAAIILLFHEVIVAGLKVLFEAAND